MRLVNFAKKIGALFILIALYSCNYSDEKDLGGYLPVVMDRTEFENSLTIDAKRNMNKAGKIYVKDQYIFVGDENIGFHVYDNSNNSSPAYIAFIRIPGATDLAIRDNVFYVNQAVDLVAFEIDFNSKKLNVLSRIKNVFPNKPSPNGSYIKIEDDKVLIDWKKR